MLFRSEHSPDHFELLGGLVGSESKQPLSLLRSHKLSSINPNELAEHIEKLNEQLGGGKTEPRLVKF